jgi:glycosyltransferase involved in cell wall biosynthesis
MNIWVFQTGEPLPMDEGQLRPMRAINLCNKLVQAGHQVTLWSADFNHQEKKFRGISQPIKWADNFEICLIPSSGYKRNIGFGRLIDHAWLGINLNKRLRLESKVPDVAFIGYPPIEAAYIFSKWLTNRGVPYLLDVKDQWPVIFVETLPSALQPLGRLIFWPYFRIARKTMHAATGLSAMADGFLNWALDFCGKTRGINDRVFPLTTPTGQLGKTDQQAASEWWDENGVVADEVNRIYFVGSFSSAFDFLPVKDAAQQAMSRGDDVQFVLCGGGGTVEDVKDMMSGLENVIFPGWVDRSKIEVLANRCIASIAPYRNSPDFMLSIPNKIVDSLALGLPILSPLKGEVESLIGTHDVGLMYVPDAGTGKGSLYHALTTIIGNEKLRRSMSANARELYNSRFSFDQVYDALVKHLEQLAAGSKPVEKA